MPLIRPPFSYTGSKAKLLRRMLHAWIPRDGRPVVESFLGSGAFLYNSPHGGVGVDRDFAVYSLHEFLMRDDADLWLHEVLRQCFPLGVRSKDGFHLLRDKFNGVGGRDALDDPYPCAMLHVLVQLSFNSLLRFNPQGRYNVGYGRKELDLERLLLAREVARNRGLDFLHGEYDSVDVRWDEGLEPVFYFDPPYLASKYQYGCWTAEDEERLHSHIDGLHKRGARFVLTSTTRHRGVVNERLSAWMSSYHVVHAGSRMRGWSSAVSSVAKANDTDEVIVSNFLPSEK